MVTVRRGNMVELWIGPVDSPEGEFIGTWHYSYNKEIVASILRFDQSEGR